MSTLSRGQFDAAELQVRRRVAALPFTYHETAVIEFVLRRSFWLDRPAAFFKNSRQLAELMGFGAGHGNIFAAVQTLIERKVLLQRAVNWRGINTNFDEWTGAPLWAFQEFDEQGFLPFEPDLKSLRTEGFVASQNNLPNAEESSGRGRDAGASPMNAEVITTPGIQSPASDFPMADAPAEDKWSGIAARFCKDLDEGRAHEKYLEVPRSNAMPDRPFHAEAVLVSRTEPARTDARKSGGGAASASRRSPVPRPVPAEAVLKTRTEPAMEAWEWAVKEDNSNALGNPLFAAPWRKLCDEHPDYVLNVLARELARARARYAGEGRKIVRTLALLAFIAQADGKMAGPARRVRVRS